MAFFSGLGKLLFGEKDKFKQLPTQTPEQQALLKNLLSNLAPTSPAGQNYQASQNYLSQLLAQDPGIYQRFAAPYMQQFEQQTIPQLAERFAGIGGGLGGGAFGSSGFGQAIGGAGAGLQSQLANLFANLQRGAAEQSMGQYGQLTGMGLSPRPFENLFMRGSTGALGGLASGLASGLGMGTGFSGMNALSNFMGGGFSGADRRSGIDQGFPT